MKQNYFIYNGVKHPTGTVIKMKQYCSYPEKIRFATFIYYDTLNDTYTYKFNDTCQQWTVGSKIFFEDIRGITDKFDPSIKIPEVKQLKDRQIDGLFIGWVWYIVIMLGLIIFKQALLGWIFVSIVFFKWRREKIKKEGYYVER